MSQPTEYVPLISCIMSSQFPPLAADVCLAEVGVVTTSPDQVSTCAQSDEGSQLLHNIGVETLSLDPPLYFVPWIIFNDEFDEDLWEQSLIDFKKVLCDNFLSDSEACQ